MDTLKKYHQSSKTEKFTDLERMAENVLAFLFYNYQSKKDSLRVSSLQEARLSIWMRKANLRLTF
jgi:hypothetical protein